MRVALRRGAGRGLDSAMPDGGSGRAGLVRRCSPASSLPPISVRPFVAFWPGSLPRAEEIHLDWRVLFVCSRSVASERCPLRTGSGLTAFRCTIWKQALRTGGRAIAGSSQRLNSLFVISEVALAFVLLLLPRECWETRSSSSPLSTRA